MKPERFLLVDDDTAFNFLNRLLLDSMGLKCEVAECLDGVSALDYINTSEKYPDIILLDINMPVMDGFEFLNEFEKNDRAGVNTQVYVLTSSDHEQDRAGALSHKCVRGYFDKPLTETNVHEILSKFANTGS